MDETTLVGQDAYEGALLIEKLDSYDLGLTSAFWAHDAALGIWRLILAVSRLQPASPREIYKAIQEALIALELRLELGRVAIVADNEPLIGTLREFAARATTDVVEVPLGGAEIAGAPVDTGYAYKIDSLRYEGDLLAALQRGQPDNVVLRRSSRVTVTNAFDFDFVMDDGSQALFIVAKSFSRPLSSKDVQRIALSYQGSRSGRLGVNLMIVSKTGISPNSESATVRSISRILLVKWADAADDAELQASIAAVFG